MKNKSSKTEKDRTLLEIVKRLVYVYKPERIYLFGSKARGDANQDSDFDILLIMPDDSPTELMKPAKAYEAIWGLEAAVDVHIWSHSKFESRLHLNASLPSTILREGKELYAA